MGDQQHGGIVGLRQPDHQLHHVALHDGVERCGGLVGEQQRRLQQHHRGQHDALAHAAGELVRIGAERSFRVGEAHAPEHVEDQLPAGRRIEPAVQRQPFLELPADRHRGVERGHRLLEDHADPGPAQGAQGLRRHRHHVPALEADGAARQPDRGRHEPHHGAGGQGLARAGFADDADDLPGEDLEGDVVHDLAACGADGEREARDIQQGSGPLLRRALFTRTGSPFARIRVPHRAPLIRGSSRSRSASPSRLMPSRVSEMQRPGKMPSHIAWPI